MRSTGPSTMITLLAFSRTASELLGLTEAEEALVETKLRLGDAVRTLRKKKHLSQAEHDGGMPALPQGSPPLPLILGDIQETLREDAGASARRCAVTVC